MLSNSTELLKFMLPEKNKKQNKTKQNNTTQHKRKQNKNMPDLATLPDWTIGPDF